MGRKHIHVRGVSCISSHPISPPIHPSPLSLSPQVVSRDMYMYLYVRIFSSLDPFSPPQFCQSIRMEARVCDIEERKKREGRRTGGDRAFRSPPTTHGGGDLDRLPLDTSRSIQERYRLRIYILPRSYLDLSQAKDTFLPDANPPKPHPHPHPHPNPHTPPHEPSSSPTL